MGKQNLYGCFIETPNETLTLIEAETWTDEYFFKGKFNEMVVPFENVKKIKRGTHSDSSGSVFYSYNKDEVVGFICGYNKAKKNLFNLIKEMM